MKAKDISGQKFNMLLVLEYSHATDAGGAYWKCLCDCGTIAIIRGNSISRGKTKSCGCAVKRKRDDSIVGKKIENFTVIAFSHYARTCRDQYYTCLCDCGNTFTPSKSSLKRIKSCGCKNKTGYKDITGTYWCTLGHGAKSRDLEFSVSLQEAWEIFEKQDGRCALSGIDISFPKGRKQTDQTASLDRINSNLGYTKDNVQWVHKTINKIKQNLDDTEFYCWCRLISDHFNKFRPEFSEEFSKFLLRLEEI